MRGFRAVLEAAGCPTDIGSTYRYATDRNFELLGLTCQVPGCYGPIGYAYSGPHRPQGQTKVADYAAFNTQPQAARDHRRRRPHPRHTAPYDDAYQHDPGAKLRGADAGLLLVHQFADGNAYSGDELLTCNVAHMIPHFPPPPHTF